MPTTIFAHRSSFVKAGTVPELPEVETMRRGILAMEGAVVEKIAAIQCKKRPISIKPSPATIHRKLAGLKIDKIDRWGKRLVICIAEWKLVFEPRMTGLVVLTDPPTKEHLRFKIALKDRDTDILFWDRRGLGNIQLYSPRQYENRFGSGKLGPDGLLVTEQQLKENLGNRKIEIKVGLLDQKAVAGIGNIYASEILFLAGVHPQAKCNRLSSQQWHLIHQHMTHVLHDAIKYEGSSLGDGTFRTVLNDPGRYQNHHLVYDRENEICCRCREQKIKRVVQAQRSTFYCNRCQRKRG